MRNGAQAAEPMEMEGGGGSADAVAESSRGSCVSSCGGGCTGGGGAARQLTSAVTAVHLVVPSGVMIHSHDPEVVLVGVNAEHTSCFLVHSSIQQHDTPACVLVFDNGRIRACVCSCDTTENHRIWTSAIPQHLFGACV